MTVVNIANARDDMLALFKSEWDSLPTPPLVTYQDRRPDGVEDGTSWARVTIQHQNGFQATLSRSEGKKRFRKTGILTVQIFTPQGTGLDEADNLTQTAIDAFESKTTDISNIIFRDVRSREIGQDGDWMQVNVLADFEYDVIK